MVAKCTLLFLKINGSKAKGWNEDGVTYTIHISKMMSMQTFCKSIWILQLKIDKLS